LARYLTPILVLLIRPLKYGYCSGDVITLYGNGINYDTNHRRVKECVLDIAAFIRTKDKHDLQDKSIRGIHISFDETTDASNVGVMQVIASYLDHKTKEMQNRYIGLIDCSGRQTSDRLFHLLGGLLRKYGIARARIVSMCTDDASTLTGRLGGIIINETTVTPIVSIFIHTYCTGIRIGVAKLAKDKNPFLLSFVCACHRLHTCARNCKGNVVVASAVALLKAIASYTSKSSKRRSELVRAHAELQERSVLAATPAKDPTSAHSAGAMAIETLVTDPFTMVSLEDDPKDFVEDKDVPAVPKRLFKVQTMGDDSLAVVDAGIVVVLALA